MPWQDDVYEFRQAGFTDEEILGEQDRQAQEMADAGFEEREIKEYFGTVDPDMEPVKQYFKQNISAHRAKEKESTVGKGEVQKFDPAMSLLDTMSAGWGAGWQQSVTGLVARGKSPDVILPQDAPRAAKIASMAGTLAGDFPAIAAGFFTGGVAGAAAAGPAAPVGAVIGSGAGSNALPTAIRETLMSYYEEGSIRSWDDFYDRASGILIDTVKDASIGAVTNVAGRAISVAKPLAGLAAPARTVVSNTAEVGIATTMGSAMNGQVPDFDEFLNGAAVVGGLYVGSSVVGKSTNHVVKNLQKTYAKTGVRPAEIAEMINADPTVRQDLASVNIETPKALEGLKDPVVKVEPKVEVDPAKAAEVDAAVETIMSKVGAAEKGPTDTSIKTMVKETGQRAYFDIIDKFDPIKAVSKEGYDLARISPGYGTKMQHALERGTFDFATLKNNGKSLNEIVKLAGENLKEAEAYRISKRALGLKGRDISTVFDKESAEKVVKNLGKYEKYAKEMTEFQNRNLKYFSDSGMLSKEACAAMVEAGPDYVSFKVALDEAGGGKGSKLGFLKKIKGNKDKNIQEPLISMVENMETMYRLAEINRAKSAVIDSVFKDPEQTLLTKTEPKGKLKKNQFEFFRDGEREVYETSHPLLAESIQEMTKESGAPSALMKLAKGITTFKKLGISIVPEFQLKNLFRDQLTSGVFSKSGTLPFVDIIGAMKDIVGKTDSYYTWMKSGGAGGAFVEFDKAYLDKNILKLDKETDFLGRTRNVIKDSAEFVAGVGTLLERSTRLAEFKKAAGKADDLKSLTKGAMASREVTVDFQRMGAKMAAFNSITAFFNVGIQGLDRTVRALKEDPTGVSIKAAQYITIPSIMLWYANKDDERYKEIPRWQKDLFWIIPTDDWQNVPREEADNMVAAHMKRQLEDGTWQVNKGITFRIPKPQELGLIFGSLPERILEKYFTDNPNAMGEFDETIGSLLAPNLIPDVAAPPLEQLTNYSFFRSTPLIPSYLEGVLPQDQYNEYTSETGKVLGKLISTVPVIGDTGAASPIIAENYIKSWSGSLGNYILKLTDEALIKSGVVDDPIKPEQSFTGSPFFKAFTVAYPQMNAQSVLDFKKSLREFEKIEKTIKVNQGRFEFERASFLMEGSMGSFRESREALSSLEKTARNIINNKEMTPTEKRQLLDTISYTMIEASKQGNEMVREMKKIMKETKLEQEKMNEMEEEQ